MVQHWPLLVVSSLCVFTNSKLLFCVCVCVRRSHSGDRLFCEWCNGDVVLASWEHWWDWRGQYQTQPITDPETWGTSPSTPHSAHCWMGNVLLHKNSYHVASYMLQLILAKIPAACEDFLLYWYVMLMLYWCCFDVVCRFCLSSSRRRRRTGCCAPWRVEVWTPSAPSEPNGTNLSS